MACNFLKYPDTKKNNRISTKDKEINKILLEGSLLTKGTDVACSVKIPSESPNILLQKTWKEKRSIHFTVNESNSVLSDNYTTTNFLLQVNVAASLKIWPAVPD